MNETGRFHIDMQCNHDLALQFSKPNSGSLRSFTDMDMEDWMRIKVVGNHTVQNKKYDRSLIKICFICLNREIVFERILTIRSINWENIYEVGHTLYFAL